MKSLVISPHPDDEVLGAGGTLFKRKQRIDYFVDVFVDGLFCCRCLFLNTMCIAESQTIVG